MRSLRMRWRGRKGEAGEEVEGEEGGGGRGEEDSEAVTELASVLTRELNSEAEREEDLGDEWAGDGSEDEWAGKGEGAEEKAGAAGGAGGVPGGGGDRHI